MGNVQCCASDRLHEGKPPKKPKNKKKTKKKQKENSEKTNGVGGGRIDEGVQKVATMAEDTSERAAPKAAQAQNSPPKDSVHKPEDTKNMTQNSENNSDKSDSPKNENMATARERFFGQVGTYRTYVLIPLIP